MKKKEALTNSFGSSRVKKPKTTLSPEVIEQIVESREAEKKQTPTKLATSVSEPAIKIEPIKQAVNQPIQPKIEKLPSVSEAPVTKAKQKITKKVVPAKAKNNRTRRSSEERQGIEREIKTSFDIPESIYDDMRIYLIRQKKSMREYLLELIVKDLAKK